MKSGKESMMMTITKRPTKQSIDRVVNAICSINKIPYDALMGRGRARHLIDTKRMCYAVIREIYHYPLSFIGKYFGMDHSSVIHHLKQHQSLLDWDENYYHRYRETVFKVDRDYDFVSIDQLSMEIEELEETLFEKKLIIKKKIDELENNNKRISDQQARA